MPLSIHLFCAMWPECINNLILNVLQLCVCRIRVACFQVIKILFFFPTKMKSKPQTF